MIEVTSLCGLICLGKQGENLARVVYFDEPSMWKETFGEGKCELIHQRSGDAAPYPVVLEDEGDKVCWKITESDTAMVGDGKCELHYSVDGVIVKSKIWTTTVLSSLGEASAEPPEPQKAWVDQVLEAAANVESATTHQPIIGENKNWYIWDVETEEYVDSGVCAEGSSESVYVPTKVSEFENDVGYLTEHQDISHKADKEDVDTHLGIQQEQLNSIFEELPRIDALEGQMGDIETALDNIIAIQNSLIGGDVE